MRELGPAAVHSGVAPAVPIPRRLFADPRLKFSRPVPGTVLTMSTSFTRAVVATDNAIFRSAEARPDSWRQAELVELDHTLRSAIMSTRAEANRPVMIASAQRGDQYTAVALGGQVDRRAVHALTAHLRGLLDAGTSHLVIDLSHVRGFGRGLPNLLGRVEARTVAYGGVFELTGLTPRILYAMDDDPLARVFALYRAAFDEASPHELAWASVRCPEGLDEVAEPRTPARHRSIIDMGTRGAV